MLSCAVNLKHLNLKGNQIGDSGCKELALALLNPEEKNESDDKPLEEQQSKRKKIEYLNLNTNIFTNIGLMDINRLIFRNPSLTYLDVGCNRYE